jgi:hypothetical protein
MTWRGTGNCLRRSNKVSERAAATGNRHSDGGVGDRQCAATRESDNACHGVRVPLLVPPSVPPHPRPSLPPSIPPSIPDPSLRPSLRPSLCPSVCPPVPSSPLSIPFLPSLPLPPHSRKPWLLVRACQVVGPCCLGPSPPSPPHTLALPRTPESAQSCASAGMQRGGERGKRQVG